MTVLLTRAEAATRLRVSLRTLDNLIANGEGPAIAVVRVGGRVFLSEDALSGWIDTQTMAPAAKAA